MFGLVNRGELPGSTEHEFEQLNSRLKNLWLVEHNEDGTHREEFFDFAASTHTHDASDIVSGTLDVSRIPDLDAAKIVSGTLDIARIPTLTKAKQDAQTAYKDEANVFTAAQRVNAGLGINTAPPGTAGQLALSDSIFERGRSVALGEWLNVPYNSANFAGSGATWTVQSGDQITLKYALVGKQCTLHWQLQTTSLNAGDNELRITLPLASANNGLNVGINVGESSASSFEIGFSQIVASDTVVRLYRPGLANWPISADNLSVRGSITYQIA